MTQVLNWIRDHSDFLENIFQPILDAEHLGHINAKVLKHTEPTQSFTIFVGTNPTRVMGFVCHTTPENTYDTVLTHIGVRPSHTAAITKTITTQREHTLLVKLLQNTHTLIQPIECILFASLSLSF